MYSNSRFNCAKINMVHSFFSKPLDHADRVEYAFLRSLLSAAAQRGHISDQDIQRAIEDSGACDLNLSDDEKDKIIADLWNIGDNYVGALSARQAQELRELRNLCLRAQQRGDADALKEIADLI
jgi:hypothetical protein